MLSRAMSSFSVALLMVALESVKVEVCCSVWMSMYARSLHTM